jgi:hypothetical protein
MTPQKKVPAKLPTPSGQQLTKGQSAELNFVPLSPQGLIERLEKIVGKVDSLPIPEGTTGAQLLEVLELTDRVRDRIRARVKELLVANPHLIPRWHVEQAVILKLCRDKEGEK